MLVFWLSWHGHCVCVNWGMLMEDTFHESSLMTFDFATHLTALQPNGAVEPNGAFGPNLPTGVEDNGGDNGGDNRGHNGGGLPAEAPLPPSAFFHTLVTDALIVKFFDVHGPDKVSYLVDILGGEMYGYSEAWVLQRFFFLLDEINQAPREEACKSPPLLAPVITQQDEQNVRQQALENWADTHGDTHGDTHMDTHMDTHGDTHSMQEDTAVVHTVEVGVRHAWQPHEDAAILRFVSAYGPRWRALSRFLGGRALGYSDDSIRNRYNRLTGVTDDRGRWRAPRKRRPKNKDIGRKWSIQEDKILIEAHTELQQEDPDTKWPRLASLLVGRTCAAVRLRAQRLGLVEYRHKAPWQDLLPARSRRSTTFNK